MYDKRLRGRIADEAARLLLLRSESEYARAKRKAARNIGVRFEPRDLPSNREVHRRLEHLAAEVDGGLVFPALRAVQIEALRWMRTLSSFHPRLAAAPRSDAPPDALFTLSVAGADERLMAELRRLRVDYLAEEWQSGGLTISVRGRLPFRIVDAVANDAGVSLEQYEKELAEGSAAVDLEAELLGLDQPADRFDDLHLMLRQLEHVPCDDGDAGDLLHHSLQVFDLVAAERPYDEEMLTAALVHEIAAADDSGLQTSVDLLEGVVTRRTRMLVDWMAQESDPTPAVLSPDDRRDVLLLRRCDDAGREAGAATRSLDAAVEHLRSLDRGEF